jgi:tRNA1(Val) A37 N6-methylase TrmN6
MHTINDTRSISFKPQEVKFVEWSQEAKASDYDIAYILSALQAIHKPEINVMDVGGGMGAVGRVLAEASERIHVDVVDNSALAAKHFLHHDRLRLIYDDFLNVHSDKKYDVMIFRTVLHHIIGNSSRKTLALQHKAISKARDLLHDDGRLIIIENFYDPVVSKDLSGEIIFQCTKLKAFAPIFRRLGANTAGEGVRFRSLDSWLEMFHSHQLEMFGDIVMERWNVPLPLWQRVPLLCRQKYQALIELRKVSRPPADLELQRD